ncbi:MAG: FAD-binding oxidoreductase [Chloroflexota bacterium]
MTTSRSTELRNALAGIAGEANVLAGDEAAQFSGDALGAGRGSTEFPVVDAADVVVVRPGTAEEIAAVVRLANERRIAIVPHGGGSGLMGGAMPLAPSIVIDVTRMNRVLEVNRDEQTIVVQAGAVLGDVNRELEAQGLEVGHDPWTQNVATVGGTISTDSLGYLGAKYGSMGDQVLQLTVVLPDGSVLRTGTVAKASVGPDLERLFIAAEGCFGVIAEARLRVFPLPEERELLAFEFDSFEKGIGALLAMRSVGLVPDIMEFDEAYGGDFEADPPALNIGFQGYSEYVGAAAERARVMCKEAGGLEQSREDAWSYWEHRHDIGDRFAQRRRSGQPQRWFPPGSGFDYSHVTMRVSRVLEFRERALAILREKRVRPAEIGVWCHPELISVYASYDDGSDGALRLTAAVDEILQVAQELGGAMEYCHGVGVRLAHLMQRERGHSLDVLRSIKETLDPNGIMNPGKLGL